MLSQLNSNILKACVAIYIGALLLCSSCAIFNRGSASSWAFIDLGHITIPELHRAILTHQITCFEIVHKTIERIKHHNLSTKAKAPLNAIVAINPQATKMAQDLDDYFKTHNALKGPLHCVTVAVKDNIDTYDLPTSAGSLALLRSQPNFDAPIINKMRNAGAVIFLKTAMDELASGMAGQSSLSGRIGNFFDPLHNPGGSSGGSAVAVAAGFAQVGLGTDNSGSVRIPAAFNGIFGLRPSRGIIDHRGVFPRGALDGEVGPMARSMTDLEILYQLLRSDNLSKGPDKSTLNSSVPLKGMAFGVVKEIAGQSVYKNTSSHGNKYYHQFFDQLKRSGVILKDLSFPLFDIDRTNNMAGEVEEIDAYLLSFPAARRNYRDLCLSTREDAFEDVDKCLAHLKETKPKHSATYDEVLARFRKNQSHVESIMAQSEVDLLLSPITYSAESTYDPWQVLTWQLPLSSNSGLSSLAFVFGQSDEHAPVFIEMISKTSSEPLLFRVAKAIESTVERPRTNIKEIHPNDSLLNDFDIPMLNNLFATIGWNTHRHRQQTGQRKAIHPPWFRHMVLETIMQHRKRLLNHQKKPGIQ